MFIGLNTPEDFLRVIINHRWLIIWPILLSVGLACGVYLWLPKSYRATTLLNFEMQKVQFIKGVAEPSGGGREAADVMVSRINVMREFLYNQQLLTQVGQEFHLYGYEKAKATEAEGDAVTGKMRSLVKFDSKEAPFIRVSFADPEPEVAKAVTTRLAELFIQEFSQNREVITTASSEFIQQELDKLKRQLEEKERALAQFKQTHLGQLPEQMTSNINALDRLDAEKAAQQERETALHLRLVPVDKAIREYEDPTSSHRGAKDPRLGKIKALERSLAGLQSLYKETYPDVARVRNEIRQLQAMTTEDYIAQYVEQEPIEVEGETRERRKLVDPYKAEMLKQREDILRELELVHHRNAHIAAEIKKYEARIEGTTIHQQEWVAVQRDYEDLQKNYHALVEKKLSVNIAGNLEKQQQGTQMRIIDPARVPPMPESPNVFMIMFGGLGIGCALGFGSAFGLELLRRGFVSAEEIEIVLGLPVLAVISQFESAWPGSGKTPSWESRRQGRLLALPGLMREESPVPKETQVAVAPELVAMWYPTSAVAEQYRVAATRLGLITGKQKSTVVCMSSALMGEGKTSTALNMAYVLSRDLNRKTVLVDCDLKRPTVRAYTGMESTAGLTEVLLGHNTLDECLEYHEQLGIWVLSAGIEASGTTALTHVDRLSELIQGLRERFEYIVLDSPPLLPVAEAMLIVRMADVVVHVIRARSTPRDVVTNAIKMIGQERAVAVVLNGVEAKDTPYSYYNYSNRVYESHHQQLLR
ncbi:MAG TPA: AAA family ATPase [Nitrospiraceae bacterium]|nr:AAA family ATPase [Nitrospiraceae bacterium]